MSNRQGTILLQVECRRVTAGFIGRRHERRRHAGSQEARVCIRDSH